ncbi:tetratricopeptide repeat protein [Verrucomicrobiota bacterium sgz303538]
MDEDFHSRYVLRGLQLKDLGRYPEAESAFREALGQNPQDAFALYQLATCQFHQPERQREALDTIAQAIALEPEEAEHFVLRSFILSSLNRTKEALAAARQALELEPYSSFAFTAEAQAHLQMEHWAEAELSARQALAIDAENSLAANQLAHALRLQNKVVENAEHLAGMLARDPEDAFTHANAGWTELQRGKHREAETHFREALRLDPELDYAREGLLNSFRARSSFYRAYLQYSFWMQRLSSGSRWMVILGLYFGVKLSRLVFQGPYKLIAIVLGILYFVLVLWVWLAKGAGNFILLFDPFAKHALRRNEKVEAVLVGGGVCTGIVLFALGFWLNILSPIVLGAALVAAAFPFSMTFTNESRAGRMVFGSIGALMIGSAVLLSVLSFFATSADNVALQFFGVGLVACLASTWLGNIPALRR